MYLKNLKKLNSGLCTKKAFTDKQLRQLNYEITKLFKGKTEDAEDVISHLFVIRLSQQTIKPTAFYIKCIDNFFYDIKRLEKVKFPKELNYQESKIDDCKNDIYRVLTKLEKINKVTTIITLKKTIEFVLNKDKFNKYATAKFINISRKKLYRYLNIINSVYYATR